MRLKITPWALARLWLRRPVRRAGRWDDAVHGAGGRVDLKLGHETVDQAIAARKGRR